MARPPFVAKLAFAFSFSFNASAGFSGLFTVNYGADGAATVTPTVYKLSVDAINVSGLIDTATGEPVTLAVNAEGTEVTGTAGGNNVLTITIDSATGVIALDQLRAVKHSIKTDHNDSIAFNTDAISITALATDGDGDEVSSSIAIGDRFVFLDDGPSVTSDTSKVGAIQLDETNLTGTSHSITVSDFASGVFVTDFGADGEAKTAAFVYSLTVTNNGVDSGLKDTASGENVLLRINNNEIEGYIADGNETVVFKVSVDSATGSLTLEQFRALNHPDTDNRLFAFKGVAAF